MTDLQNGSKALLTNNSMSDDILLWYMAQT